MSYCFFARERVVIMLKSTTFGSADSILLFRLCFSSRRLAGNLFPRALLSLEDVYIFLE